MDIYNLISLLFASIGTVVGIVYYVERKFSKFENHFSSLVNKVQCDIRHNGVDKRLDEICKEIKEIRNDLRNIMDYLLRSK